MHREPVASGSLKSVGYEAGMLEAEFPNGQVWRYQVTEEEWGEFQAAESKGRYFQLYIRPLGGERVDLS